MKVIKEGKWNVPWSCERACPTCEAVLLVEEADVGPVHYGYAGTFECACSVCGHKIPIAGNLLPLRIKEALEKKRKYHTSSGWD